MEKYCGNDVDDAEREKFFSDKAQFLNVWISEEEKCEGKPTTPEERCMDLSGCFFGSALTSAKNGFSEDAVSTVVIVNQVSFGAAVEKDYGEDVPTSCDVLFEPNEPEPPYEPGPNPYEPYQPSSYQRNPYQRSSYQRNPYQRNPYQRNTYQRKPYRRNPYQRNPYRRN